MNEAGFIPIFDGHNDFSERLEKTASADPTDIFFLRQQDGHIDLPRAREGGFAGGMFAIFIESPKPAGAAQKTKGLVPGGMPSSAAPGARALPLPHSDALAASLRRIELLKALERRDPASVCIVRGVPELRSAMDEGRLAIVIHFEGAEAIAEDSSNLEELYGLGLRSLGLVWSRQNVFASGVPFAFPGGPDIGPGLTPAGRKLVRECNRLGILIDLSHMNEKGFWDVAELSAAPLVASHSCVHAICPCSRNLTDEQIKAIARSRGIVGLNFAVSFLRPDGAQNADTPLSVLADHCAHIAELAGPDCLGIGSDFDGTGIPRELGDVSGLQRLIAALRERGFGEDELEKIASKNWLRVLEASWK